MKPRIAIAGKMGSGKTTLANRLADKLDLPVLRFATPIKDLVNRIGLEPGTDEYRKACQVIGSYLRQQDEDHWVWAFLQAYRYYPNGAVVDDLRYVNELDSLIGDGFFIIKLDVADEIRMQRRPELVDAKVRNHESETGLDDVPGNWFHMVLYDEFDLDRAVQAVTDRCKERFGVS